MPMLAGWQAPPMIQAQWMVLVVGILRVCRICRTLYADDLWEVMLKPEVFRTAENLTRQAGLLCGSSK